MWTTSLEDLISGFKAHFGPLEHGHPAAIREFFIRVGEEFHSDIFEAISPMISEHKTAGNDPQVENARGSAVCGGHGNPGNVEAADNAETSPARRVADVSIAGVPRSKSAPSRVRGSSRGLKGTAPGDEARRRRETGLVGKKPVRNKRSGNVTTTPRWSRKAKRENWKQEILGILSADPSHAFTIAGVAQRMVDNTLTLDQLRRLLNEGVREQRWRRHRSNAQDLTGWHVHDGVGEADLDFTGSDKEKAAWTEQEAKDRQKTQELVKMLRAAHPEWQQPGEDEEAWKVRHAE